jgi:hypothetical protein
LFFLFEPVHEPFRYFETLNRLNAVFAFGPECRA